MAADRPRRGAGRIEQDRVERLGRFEGGGIGHDVSASSLSRSRLARRRSMRGAERSTAVTCAPAAASCAVLPPGAAQRSRIRSPGLGARILAGRAAAASCTHQAPSAKPGSCGIAVRAVRRIEPVGSRVPPSRSAQRAASLAAVRSTEGSRRWAGRDGARARLAIGGRPALAQPGGRVGHERIGSCEDRVPLGRQPPQHGVGEIGEVAGVAILAGERHRRIDGGVARGPEHQDLRGGGDQDRLELAAPGRQAARHPLGERLPDQPVAAHGRRGDGAHEAAVARSQRLKGGIGGEPLQPLVERHAALDHVLHHPSRRSGGRARPSGRRPSPAGAPSLNPMGRSASVRQG